MTQMLIQSAHAEAHVIEPEYLDNGQKVRAGTGGKRSIQARWALLTARVRKLGTGLRYIWTGGSWIGVTGTGA